MKVTVVGAGNVGASCAEYIAIKRIASFHSKEDLLAKLEIIINSTLSKLVWALKSPLSYVTNLLSNVKEKESKKN